MSDDAIVLEFDIEEPIYVDMSNVNPETVYAGTIEVGTVTTLDPGESATVFNSGTVHAAIFDFGIPDGADGAQGPTGPQGPQGPAGADGAPGAAGPNEVTTTTDTDINGILMGDGSKVKQAVGAIDYMPAYDPSEFVAWQDETVYDIGDKVTASIPKYLLYLICKKEHISDTTYDPTKFITVYVQDIRLDTIEGIVVIDIEGNSSAAAQSDIEAILTGEVTSHTHPITDEIEFSLINAWRY